MAFKKTPHVKVNSRSKVMPVFVFYLWHHHWQALRTAANFAYNSSLSRSTRILILGQVFSKSLWKLVKMENTCFKTLKLKNNCKIVSDKCKTGTVLWHHFSKFFKTVSK